MSVEFVSMLWWFAHSPSVAERPVPYLSLKEPVLFISNICFSVNIVNVSGQMKNPKSA